jgi:hypothetical protein
MQPANFKMPNRQALEELEKSGASPSPLLSCEEAAALVERGDRSIGALTYGWLSPGDPDPDGSRIRVLRRALMGMAIRIEALFWDFGSLYQNPRTPEQTASFDIALKGGAMNQLYASILATTVLQIEEIPLRPAEFDGVVCLFKLSAHVDENKVRAALIGFGTIKSCDLSHSPPIVRFASHLSAVKAKEVGVSGMCTPQLRTERAWACRMQQRWLGQIMHGAAQGAQFGRQCRVWSHVEDQDDRLPVGTLHGPGEIPQRPLGSTPSQPWNDVQHLARPIR